MGERGVTPVVGEIILIGVVVAVASIMAVSVAQWAIVPGLPPNVILGAEAESFDNVVRLTITHEGGDTLATGDLFVQAEDENGLREVDISWPAQLSLGDKGIVIYSYGTNPVGKEIKVRVVSPAFNIILFTTIVGLTIGSEDWSVFQHDVGHTGFSTSLPPENGKMWSQTFEAGIKAPPVVADGNIYVGLGDSFYCLDANTGDIRWKSSLKYGIDNSLDNYRVSPVVAGGRVYIPLLSPAGKMRTYCLDASDGEVVWSSVLATAWTPIVSGGRLYGGSGGATFCLNANNGNVLWYTPGSFEPTGVIGENNAYAYADEKLLDPSDVKIKATPAGPEAIENLGSSDDNWWKTNLAGRYYLQNDQQYFVFKPGESTSEAVVGTLSWEGHAEDISGACGTKLWLWNSVTHSWEMVSEYGAASGDHTLSFTASDFSSYINETTGELWLAATGSRENVWWDNSWHFRRPLTYTYDVYIPFWPNRADLPDNYVITFVVPYDNHMRPDFSDLRFTRNPGGTYFWIDKNHVFHYTTNPSENPLNYWIENYVENVSAKVWVAVPGHWYQPRVSAWPQIYDPIWMYYGNENATRAENKDAAISIMHYDNYWVTEVRETGVIFYYYWCGVDNVKGPEDNYPADLHHQGASKKDYVGYMEVGFDNENEDIGQTIGCYRVFMGATKITVWELNAGTMTSGPGVSRNLEAREIENKGIAEWADVERNVGLSDYSTYRRSHIVNTSTSFRYLRLYINQGAYSYPDWGDYYLGSIEVEGHSQAYLEDLYHINIGEEQPRGGLYTDYVELKFFTLPLPGPSPFSPAADGEKVYTQSKVGLSCFNAYSGENLWENNSVGLTSTPVISNGKVYFSTRNQVYSFNANNGQFLDNFQVSNPSTPATPAVAYGKVYIGSNGGFYCLDANNLATVIWENPSMVTTSTPAIASHRVYFGAGDNYFYCLNSENGDFIWKYKTDSSSFTAPAIANGRVYVCSGNAIYCFGPATPFIS